MTAYYSDNIADSSANTTLVAGYRPSAGIKHARTRVSTARVSGLLLTTDIARMITLQSGDRLLKLELTSNGGSDAGAVNIGLYLSGSAHDGAVVDADLFASAQTISTAIDLTDVFNESAVLDHTDRGKTMWELAAVGAGSDTIDPLVQYDIVIVPSTSFTTTASILTLIATYMAGD
jgi:hypothetical protein